MNPEPLSLDLPVAPLGDGWVIQDNPKTRQLVLFKGPQPVLISGSDCEVRTYDATTVPGPVFREFCCVRAEHLGHVAMGLHPAPVLPWEERLTKIESSDQLAAPEEDLPDGLALFGVSDHSVFIAPDEEALRMYLARRAGDFFYAEGLSIQPIDRELAKNWTVRMASQEDSRVCENLWTLAHEDARSETLCELFRCACISEVSTVLMGVKR